MFGVSKVAAGLWKVNTGPEVPQQQSFTVLFQLRAEITQRWCRCPELSGLFALALPASTLCLYLPSSMILLGFYCRALRFLPLGQSWGITVQP